MSFGKLSRSSGNNPVFVKLTPTWNSPNQGSEEKALVDPQPHIEFEEQVKEFTLATKTSLQNKMDQTKETHLRPMSDAEYNQYISLLKTQKDKTGNLLYKHDLAAIARVVKENFLKFFPSLAIDYNVDNSLEFHYEVDHVLEDMYIQAYEKYRQPFITTKAEEVKANYTPDEIVRLRNLGVAFTGGAYKVYDNVEELLQETPVETRKNFIQRAYQHPMLKYNLLKGKK